MSAQNAVKCFNENIKLFANPKSNPEGFNLYNGLSNIADAIQRIADDMDKIKRTIDRIERKSR